MRALLDGRLCKRCDQRKEDSEFYSGAYYCKDCNRARARERHARLKHDPSYRDKQKNKELKRLYGITIEDKRRMLAEQNNKCAICEKVVTESAHTDHSHSSGKVRGLLCSRCNAGIGYFKEDPEIIASAIRYLEEHSARTP